MQNFSRAERIAAAVYFIWFFIHLGFFFYPEEGTDPSLPGVPEPAYDILDFVLYVGSPLILFIAYKIVVRNTDTATYSSGQRRQSSNFFLAFLDEKIKAEELTQKINELTNQAVSFDHLDELKADREKAVSKGVSTWFARAEVKSKYKDFQR